MTRATITRVTHSCHLLDLDGTVVLTDPWFTTKPGYDPGEPLAFTVDELPELDLVVISHAHYDHCDLDAFRSYRDLSVPLIGPASVAEAARAAGFTDVREVAPWDSVAVGGVVITAVPGAHAVEEVTFVIASPAVKIFFGGDSLLIPSMLEMTQRVGQIDVALVPTNGLRLKPLHDIRVVMDSEDAARLVAVLQPTLAIPHHYRFVTGEEPEGPITSSDPDPQHFVESARTIAPGVAVRVTVPGEKVEVA